MRYPIPLLIPLGLIAYCPLAYAGSLQTHLLARSSGFELFFFILFLFAMAISIPISIAIGRSIMKPTVNQIRNLTLTVLRAAEGNAADIADQLSRLNVHLETISRPLGSSEPPLDTDAPDTHPETPETPEDSTPSQ